MIARANPTPWQSAGYSELSRAALLPGVPAVRNELALYAALDRLSPKQQREYDRRIAEIKASLRARCDRTPKPAPYTIPTVDDSSVAWTEDDNDLI